MQFGFSTLGVPEVTLADADRLLRRFSLDFLELRSLENTCDLPDYFGRTPFPPSLSPIRLLATSLRLAEASPADLTAFYAFAEWAEKLNVPYLRVFGSGGSAPGPIEDQLRRAAETVAICRRELARRNYSTRILLETHSCFSSSANCLALAHRLDEPLEILWDSHHTRFIAGESIEETWTLLGPWIRHIHYKDSLPHPTAKEGRRYVLPGEGDYPSEALLAHLRANGFEGGLSLEWEKLWHPELAPLAAALESFSAIAAHRG